MRDQIKKTHKRNDLSIKAQIQIFFEMIIIVWKAGSLNLLNILIIEIVLSLFPLGQSWITRVIFNYLSLDLSNRPIHSIIIGILPMLIIQIILTVLNTIFSSIISFQNSELERKISLTSHLNLFKKIKEIQGLSPFEDPETQSEIKMASQGLQMGPSRMVENLINLVRSLITLLSFTVVLLSYNWIFVILILFSVIPQLFLHLKLNKKRFALSYENSFKQRRVSYFASILTLLPFAKEVFLNNMSAYFEDGFEKMTKEINNSQRMIEHKEMIGQTWLSVLFNIISGVAFVCVILQAFYGEISIGDVTFFTSAFSNIHNSLIMIISILVNINESTLFFSSYKKLNQIPQPIKIATTPVALPPLNDGIKFENVSFRYDQNKPWVLKNINLFIPANQSMALVGENGAGKTTLVKLLVRFYDPTEGKILWDGIDISRFDVIELRKKIGAIFQDFIHYELSAFENIALGDIEYIYNIKQNITKIKKAACEAGIHEVIEQLPKGYQSILSRWMAEDKQGVNLSGGEWQKVALARLFIKEAECLILDEPTAALDSRAENEIYMKIVNLITKKTCIIISHRFSTVRLANVIAVLQNGTIVEYGSHESLLELDGIYAELFRKQAERYK